MNVSVTANCRSGNGWIRYSQVRWWRLLDAVSSVRSLSVLLSAVETTRTTWIALVLAWWLLSQSIHTCPAYTRYNYYSRAVFISFRASDCAAREATIRGQHLSGISITKNTCRQLLQIYTSGRCLANASQPTSCMPQLLCLPWPPSWFVVMCEPVNTNSHTKINRAVAGPTQFAVSCIYRSSLISRLCTKQ